MLHPPKGLKVKTKGMPMRLRGLLLPYLLPNAAEVIDLSGQKALQDGVLSGDEGGGRVHG